MVTKAKYLCWTYLLIAMPFLPPSLFRDAVDGTLLTQRMEGDTSPQIGCCKVAARSCGGNVLKMGG